MHGMESEKCRVCYETYVALVPKCLRVSPRVELTNFTPETKSETSSFLSALVCEHRKNKLVNVIYFTLTNQVIRVSVCLVARIVMIVCGNFEGSVHIVDVLCGSCLAVLSVSHITFLWAVCRGKVVLCMPERRMWEKRYSSTCSLVCFVRRVTPVFGRIHKPARAEWESCSSRTNSDTTMLWDSCPLSLSTQHLLIFIQLLSPRPST